MNPPITVKPILHTENSIADVKYADGSPAQIADKFSPSDIKKDLFVFIQDSVGNKYMFKSRTISYNDSTFVAPFPNPVHLFLKTAIESYNNSCGILKSFEHDRDLGDPDEKVFMLNVDESFTNQNYNDFVRFRITAIISAIAALETFLNQIIPNTFIYGQKRGLNCRTG